MEIIPIKCSAPYNVYLGENLISNLSQFIDKNYSCALIITDDNVDKIYSENCIQNLKNCFPLYKYVFPHGETSKNINEYIKITNFMAEKSMDRKSLVIALGGGVTGDLSGFVSSTYMRGIDFIQIPTSLLAMVDSSVGGKTAVDTPSGKNMLGTFCQPKAVICDINTLSTLPSEYISDGLGEIIKYSILNGGELFQKLSNHFTGQDIKIISHCIKIKAEIVAADEFEENSRQLLNLGHTFGHAIELLSDFKLSHGKAVAKGIYLIAEISYKNRLCSEEVFREIQNLLNFHGFNLQIPYTYQQIFDIIKHDKKKNGEFINLVIPENIGNCKIMKISFNQLYQMMIQE